MTHRNTQRKMPAIGPVVAADSESNLRTFRSGGAPCVAFAGFSDLSLAPVGNRLVTVSDARACSSCVRSDCNAPPGLRHRRFASERA